MTIRLPRSAASRSPSSTSRATSASASTAATSMCVRFLTVLPSGTSWKKIRGTPPSARSVFPGDQTACERLGLPQLDVSAPGSGVRPSGDPGSRSSSKGEGVSLRPSTTRRRTTTARAGAWLAWRHDTGVVADDRPYAGSLIRDADDAESECRTDAGRRVRSRLVRREEAKPRLAVSAHQQAQERNERPNEAYQRPHQPEVHRWDRGRACARRLEPRNPLPTCDAVGRLPRGAALRSMRSSHANTPRANGVRAPRRARRRSQLSPGRQHQTPTTTSTDGQPPLRGPTFEHHVRSHRLQCSVLLDKHSGHICAMSTKRE